MASIISTGIGSGLDVAGIVQQLVAAEGEPAEKRLSLQEARTQAKLSAFGTLKSALADFRDTLEIMQQLDSFLRRKATSGNESVFSVSVDESALPAAYSIEVEELALAQKLTSDDFTDADTVVGTGTLTIAIGSESFELEITDDNSTLAGIRDAINSALDNIGVAATIVNAEDGSYLVLTAQKTGADNGMTITQTGGDGGLEVLEYDSDKGKGELNESQEAQDALLQIDGFDVVSDTNVITGAIDGVTITLLAESDGDTDTLLIENDEAAVRETLDKFVTAYNTLVDSLESLTSYDSQAELAAPLFGDASMRGIRDQIRREMSDIIHDPDLVFGSLREIGIETQLDGKLSIVDAELSTILANDFLQLGQFFANPNGHGVRLFSLVDRFLGSDGIIETRSNGLNTQIEGIDEEREALFERLGLLETRLLRQFNALDALVGQLTNISNFLTQQLANLPTVSSNN